MDRLSSEDVKRIAEFLDFKGMVNLSQTRQPFQADLRPLIRKAEVTMMKEDRKIKQVVTTLTRALIQIEHVALDDDLQNNDCRGWVEEILHCVGGHFNFGGLRRLQLRQRIDPLHPGMDLHMLGNPISIDWFEGPQEDNTTIVQHLRRSQ